MDEPEWLSNGETEHKRPFKWIQFAVRRIVKTAIPLHLDLLAAHHQSIKQLENEENWPALHAEEARASNTILLLRGDLYELQAISVQVEDEDKELFQEETEEATKEVLNALAAFLELRPDVMTTRPRAESNSSSLSKAEFPTLVCSSEAPISVPDDNRPFDENPLPPIQVLEPLKNQRRWSKLRSELQELNELFRKFASLVFSQKESVNSIEENVQHACDNVQEGTKQLRRAVILQAAAFPAAGAAIGGLLLGPVGAAVGFKLFGSVACALSGCAIGYGVGRKIKQKRYESCDIEMKALTYSSKSASVSSPDIVQIPELITSIDTDKTADHNSD